MRLQLHFTTKKGIDYKEDKDKEEDEDGRVRGDKEDDNRLTARVADSAAVIVITLRF